MSHYLYIGYQDICMYKKNTTEQQVYNKPLAERANCLLLSHTHGANDSQVLFRPNILQNIWKVELIRLKQVGLFFR